MTATKEKTEENGSVFVAGLKAALAEGWSKKLIVLVFAFLAAYFREELDIPEDLMTQLIQWGVGGYMVGQGIADFGKGAEKVKNGNGK